jgi:hypothetical protein
MPGRRCWTALCLSVTNDTSNYQIRLVHDSSESDSKSVPQFTTLMNGTRCLGIDVTRKAMRSGEASDEVVETLFGLRVLRVEFL